MVDIRIDTSSLTHTQFLIPELSSEIIEGANTQTISLEPGVHGFQQMSALVANFRFEVTPEGFIDYDIVSEGFLSGRGTTTLTVMGFTITLDARSLSHDLLPMESGASVLSRERTHELTLVPAMGYTFQPTSGISADFRFDLGVNGEVIIDPRYGGFATANGRSLIISGYQITIDGRQLSHDLGLFLFGNRDTLTRDRTHELTLVPAMGYTFQPTSGILADFRFDLGVNEEVIIDPRYRDFATTDGRALIISGYQITIDGRQLSHDLGLFLFGNEDVLSRERTHELILLPAASPYVLKGTGNPETQFQITVNTNGEIAILGVPGGLIIMRPLPPPDSLRSAYADLFLPSRGSAGEFISLSSSDGSLREAIRTYREVDRLSLRSINGLFRGGTSEEEEDQALALLLGSRHAADLINLVNSLTWERLDDELDEGDLTQIMDRLKVLLDRRDYLVGFLLRWLFLVENERLPNIDSINVLRPFAVGQTLEVRHSFADQSLNQRDAVLDGLGLMALRGLPTYAREFQMALDTAAGSELYRAPELQRLSWEVFYTNLICTQLASGEYRLLQLMLTELFNPGSPQFLFPVRNIALFNMLRKWEGYFYAMERLISILGSERQKTDMRRYMENHRLFMNNFPAQLAPPAPLPGFLAAIQQAYATLLASLLALGSTFQDLVNAVQSIADSIQNIGSSLFEATGDEEAVAAVNTMFGEDKLAMIPTQYKVTLAKKMYIGFAAAVEDDEEQAILTILRASKTRSPAEFLQIAASINWEILDSIFDGTEHSQLEELFRF
jgi:hypothetical protein